MVYFMSNGVIAKVLLTLFAVSVIELKEDDGSSTLPRALSPPSRMELWQTAPSCGANSLYFMLRLLDKDVTMQEVRDRVTTTGKGASLGELKDASHALGVDLEVRRIAISELAGARFPIIALLGTNSVDDMGHFVVLVSSLEGGGVTGIDGTSGDGISISSDSLREDFSGFVVTQPAAWTLPSQNSLYIAGIATCAIEAVVLLFLVIRRFGMKGSLSPA